MKQLSTPKELSAEAERIRAEFVRRREAIPSGFYGWDRPVNFFFQTQLCRLILDEFRESKWFPLTGRRVLDIGCGSGRWLMEFAQWGADCSDLAGIDLGDDRLDEARRKLPAADLRLGNAQELPWPDQSFDLVTQFVVFTSVLDSTLQENMAREMLRVLKPGGKILWYDFRVDNPDNPNVRSVRVERIRQLFPNCKVRITATTLAPPLARRIVPISWPLAALVERVPFLRTHYFGVIEREPGA